ncbi:MAG: DUF4174 domain-containing protein [Pseudomonadota bacterium]
MTLALAAALLSIGPGLGPVPAAELDAGLSAYRWEARPILIFAAEDDPRLGEQLTLLREGAAELRERENVIVVGRISGSPLAERFRPEGFTLILVGKDGGEKLRADRVVAVDALNALIDGMPMRRREMRTGG